MNNSIAEILANSFQQLYRRKLTTSSGGNLSMKDGDKIWVSPSAKDKAYLETEDFIPVCYDGSCPGNKKVSMETPFHLALYKAYPNTKAICHVHPKISVALSLINIDEIKPILTRYNLGFANYAIPGSIQLGENIVKAFDGDVDAVVMQNHGIIFKGDHIEGLLPKVRELELSLASEYDLSVDMSLKEVISKDESEAFYQWRIKEYLSMDSNFSKCDQEYLLTANIPKLKQYLDEFKELNTAIIPESHIILNDLTFDDSQMSSVILNRNGDVQIKGKSLYQCYDKLEVLSFTLEVLEIARSMGDLNYLSNTQISELNKKFLS